MHSLFCLTLLILVVLSACPGLAGSLRTEELAGQWVAQAWATDMERERSPLKSASGNEPRAFTLEPVADGWFRLGLTTFHERTWRAVRIFHGPSQETMFEVGPLEQEPSADSVWEQVPVIINRNDSGEVQTLTAALWPGDNGKIRYQKLPLPAQDWALQVVFGGDDTNAPGHWVRTALETIAHGVEIRLNLDPSESCCDWLHLGNDRIGFSWQGEELRLYRMVNDPEGCPLACAKEPFLVLRSDWDGTSSEVPQSRRRSALGPLTPEMR